MADEDVDKQGDLLERQKQEKKELQGKIQALKRSVPKGDKKRKKEVTEEIAALEAKLKEKHNQENAEIVSVTSKITETHDASELLPQMNIMDINDQPEGRKVTRAQKRRDKKAALEKERQKRIEQAENIISERSIEQKKLESILLPLGLVVKEIAADGNCLYNAIADQLRTLNIQHTNQSLRELAASYMLSHSEDFLPFLIDQHTGDGYTKEKFSDYCQQLCNSSVWGGQLEIQAISCALEIPVKIFQTVGSTVEIGEQYEAPAILLSFHHHAYGLGKHYNSVIKASDNL
ncbi:deubiquitinase OTUD6B-like [Xenia sp. Carnegie-2017]|uniref:deubiquitinase OTUD6B-like n=1 Tax=Xenia sp. Carnegie-2017 TaxID=2897299 RepID=UPI001F045910|nr:deubiquitinase OTUD6B-like [Xenia sp. Carnegie-2017]